MASFSSSRNELTLKQRVEVIQYHNKNPLVSTRKLASVFSCGRTQVQLILKRKEATLEEFEANAPENRKRHRGTHFDQVNEGEFKASNGWLDSFRSRHKLKQLTVSGDVAEETIEAWQERLKVLLKGYKAEDIWNEDETGCFFRALPEKSLSERKKECRGGKKSKERITVAFVANAAGGKEFPVIIGRAAKPRCFKGLRDVTKHAGVPYYSNKKAWMNTGIMDSMLLSLNKRLKSKNRKKLLLMDNVSSHLPELKNNSSLISELYSYPRILHLGFSPWMLGSLKTLKFTTVVYCYSTHWLNLMDPIYLHLKLPRPLMF